MALPLLEPPLVSAQRRNSEICNNTMTEPDEDDHFPFVRKRRFNSPPPTKCSFRSAQRREMSVYRGNSSPNQALDAQTTISNEKNEDITWTNDEPQVKLEITPPKSVYFDRPSQQKFSSSSDDDSSCDFGSYREQFESHSAPVFANTHIELASSDDELSIIATQPDNEPEILPKPIKSRQRSNTLPACFPQSLPGSPNSDDGFSLEDFLNFDSDNVLSDHTIIVEEGVELATYEERVPIIQRPTVVIELQVYSVASSMIFHPAPTRKVSFAEYDMLYRGLNVGCSQTPTEWPEPGLPIVKPIFAAIPVES